MLERYKKEKSGVPFSFLFAWEACGHHCTDSFTHSNPEMEKEISKSTQVGKEESCSSNLLR
jgi:hypothetical protein